MHSANLGRSLSLRISKNVGMMLVLLACGLYFEWHCSRGVSNVVKLEMKHSPSAQNGAGCFIPARLMRMMFLREVKQFASGNQEMQMPLSKGCLRDVDMLTLPHTWNQISSDVDYSLLNKCGAQEKCRLLLTSPCSCPHLLFSRCYVLFGESPNLCLDLPDTRK